MLNLFALYTNSYPEYEYFKQSLFKTTIDPIKTLVHIFSKKNNFNISQQLLQLFLFKVSKKKNLALFYNIVLHN